MARLGRRGFLKGSGAAVLSWGLLPPFLARALEAKPSGKKVFVLIFQRGAMDGLSAVVPHADAGYYRMRPTIAIPLPGHEGGALPLDGRFGLHPALAPLLPLWSNGSLAAIHGVGMPHPTRSHFDAQDFIEMGTPGEKGTPDGWLNRILQANPLPNATAFRAVAMQPMLPRSLAGPAPALAVGALSDFKLRNAGRALEADSFAALYSDALDTAMRQAGTEAFTALREASLTGLEKQPPRNGAEYDRSPLARRLQDVARLVHGDVGLQVAVTDVGGWDTHVGQGGSEGQLSNRLKELASALASFCRDLGDRLADVCVVTVTEFGRTVRENGNRGTDHGTGSLMLVFGGAVKGGRVYGHLPELAEGSLFENRDVPVTTDFRQVLSEALSAHLRVSPSAAFPGLASGGNLGLFG